MIKSARSVPPFDLDPGEAEAIAIAEEMRPSALLLIDDRNAREEAPARSFSLIGTVGVLESAAVRGLIDLPSALNKLVQTSHRRSPELIKAALERDRKRKSGGS